MIFVLAEQENKKEALVAENVRVKYEVKSSEIKLDLRKDILRTTKE